MDPSTSISLIERIKSKDEDAWLEFSSRYISILEKWCKTWKIQNFDAQDVIQETLLAVMNGIQSFERRGTGSFRAWMKTIAWRCWCHTLYKAERRRDLELINSLKSSTAYENLEEQLDSLAVHELLQASMDRTRARVEEKTWQAFQLTAIESQPANQVAKLLDMRVDAVYAARCRIQRWITEEYTRLDQQF